MGSSKQKESGSSTTIVNQTTTPTPTAEEVEMNKLDLERRRAQQSGLMEADTNSINLLNQVLSGGTLPGYLQKLPEGLSEAAISDMTGKALQDMNVQLAGSGIGTFRDSGAAQAIGVKTSGDIRRQGYETNLNLLLNLLNLATGAPAQIQSPMTANNALLSSRLAGLRTVNTSGTSSSSTSSITTGMNPFWQSFQTSFGEGMGKGASAGFFASGSK